MVVVANEWQPARLDHPIFVRISDLLARVSNESAWPTIEHLNRAFEAELGLVGAQFVEAMKSKPRRRARRALDPATLYEIRIAEHGEIPTRPCNVHDFFNAVVWAAFPYAKLALTRSLAAIQRERATGSDRLPSTRTPAHDRLAMVDEGGLLCVRGAGTWIFGHAIYEHAYGGRLDVRGAPIDLEVSQNLEGLALADARRAIDPAFAAVDLATAVRAGPGIPVAV